MRNSFIKKNNFIEKKTISSIFIICLLILLVGFSYAFFVYNKTGLYTHTITGGKMSIIYSETTGNNITIENAYPLTNEEALTKGLEFEFTISGYNESDKNIYYAIEMDYGEDVENKVRFKDSDIKLSLYENDKAIYENKVFDNLDNNDIYYGYIAQGTNAELPTINNYKLRIWINDNVIISDTLSDDLTTWNNFEVDWLYENYPQIVERIIDEQNMSLSYYGVSIYTTEDFQNMYANFKVNVKADLTYDDVGYITYDANGGGFTPEKTSLLTSRITQQKPVMTNKGFLGWSSTPNGEVEYKAGDVYSGAGDILYAIYSDTRNVMDKLSIVSSYYDLSSINEIYFVNDTLENIYNRMDNSDCSFELTMNDYGEVNGWIEFDENDGVILYIGSEGTTYLSDAKKMFFGFSNLMNIDFTNVDTSMAEDMSYMFVSGSDSYGGGVGVGASQLNLNSFNTNNVTDMSYMFAGCSSLLSLDLKSFDTSNVVNMSFMFYKCKDFFELDLSNFDTSKVTTMASMFEECKGLNVIDLSHFDTSNVTDMSNMFYHCEELFKLDLSNFDTSKATNMVRMFYYCEVLSAINLNNFDTSQVTDMSNMFYHCTELFKLDLNNFDTSKVTNMGGMFNDCKSLTELDLSSFDTSKVTDMSYMFNGCNSLTILDLTNFDISAVYGTYNMFYNCSGLTTIYCNDDWNTDNIDTSWRMFAGCTSLIGAVPYDSNKTDIIMANPTTGYFTKKEM